MVEKPAFDVDNKVVQYMMRANDKFIIMPKAKKEELVIKVLLVAAAAGIISLIVFPLAPFIAIAAGVGGYLYFADQYTPGEFVSDVINNPREYLSRASDKNFQDACARRVYFDKRFEVKNASATVRNWWNSLFV